MRLRSGSGPEKVAVLGPVPACVSTDALAGIAKSGDGDDGSFLDHSGDARVSRGSAFAQIGFGDDGDAGDEFVDATRPCGRSLLGKSDQLIAIELVAWTGLRCTDLPVQDDVGGVERDRPAARDFRDSCAEALYWASVHGSVGWPSCSMPMV